MNKQSQSINTLHDVFVSDIHKFRNIEVELKKILPEWISSASSVNLKVILREYFNLMEENIHSMGSLLEGERVEIVSFPKSIVRVFAEYLSEKLSNCSDVKMKDTCVLTSIQAINQFKISMYEAAAVFAHSLKMDKHADFFQDAGSDEKRIQAHLSKLSEHEFNIKGRTHIAMAS